MLYLSIVLECELHIAYNILEFTIRRGSKMRCFLLKAHFVGKIKYKKQFKRYIQVLIINSFTFFI